MGKLTATHIVETAVWFVLAAIFFYVSFDFDQSGSIYPPGPSAWPRAIIALLVIAAIGNLVFHYVHGDAEQSGRIGAVEEDGDEGNRTLVAYLRIGTILVVPFLFAAALKPMGFFSAAPVFIVAIIMLMGERRPMPIIGITIFIYILLIFFFVVLLNANLPQGTVSPFYEFSSQILIWNTQFQNWLNG